jgi:hypothetical protein
MALFRRLNTIFGSLCIYAASSTFTPASASPDIVDATIELFFDTCVSSAADYDFFLALLDEQELNPVEPVENFGIEPWMEAPWSGHVIIEETEKGQIMLAFLGDRDDAVVACILHGVWENNRPFLHYMENLEIGGERLGRNFGGRLAGHPIYASESWAVRSWRGNNLHAIFPFDPPATITEHPFKLFRRLDPSKADTPPNKLQFPSRYDLRHR